VVADRLKAPCVDRRVLGMQNFYAILDTFECGEGIDAEPDQV
jgi:hypothetical protein